MSAGNLAFYGGTKAISKPLRRYNSIDDNEVSAVLDVVSRVYYLPMLRVGVRIFWVVLKCKH